MSSKYLGYQPVAYGYFAGTATPAAFTGEVVGFGAVTDTGTGDWTIAVDADCGIPTSGGGYQILCPCVQRALAAGSVAVPLVVSATVMDLNAWDLATPSAVDADVMLAILRWPV